MAISSLGYIGIGAKDPTAWLKFGTEVLGMMPARAYPGESWGMPGDPNNPGPVSGGSGVGPDGSVYLKMDDHQWRVAVHRHETNHGLLYLGFDTDTEADFETTLLDLGRAGVAVEETDAAAAAARSVRRLARLTDPAGNRLEIYFGATRDYKYQSPLGSNFLTGKLGFGHLNLFVGDLAGCYDFYTRLLGFRLADYLVISAEANLSANFLYCNARHHSVALTRVGDINGLHHLMFQLDGIDGVGCIMDRVQKAGMKITSRLGRHTNDHMLSFYVRSPSGFDVEIGCDGLLIDETWVPNQFCEGDVWGHQGLTVEAIAEMAAGIQAAA